MEPRLPLELESSEQPQAPVQSCQVRVLAQATSEEPLTEADQVQATATAALQAKVSHTALVEPLGPLESHTELAQLAPPEQLEASATEPAVAQVAQSTAPATEPHQADTAQPEQLAQPAQLEQQAELPSQVPPQE